MTPDVPVRIELPGKVVHLLGTAHVSQASVDAVRRAVVELDADRLAALRSPERWRNLDLFRTLKEGKGSMLLANLALASFQKRMGLATGVKPGGELLAAVEEAEARGTPIRLIDRVVRTTLLRAWRQTGAWKKIELLGALLASAFEKPDLGEEDLAKLREQDTLSALLAEVGEAMPAAKATLIDERDRYLAEGLRRAPGTVTLGVVGAAHVPGIRRELEGTGAPVDLAALDAIPPRSRFSRAIPWVVPAIVLALFVVGFAAGDTTKLAQAAWAWVLANGSLSALGALVALGHPAAIATAFVAAPITSLNPTVGAGMVAGAAQAWASRPRVGDLEGLLDDLAHWQGWWTNRVSRVLLVFFFSNLGSSLGTFVAFGWLKDLV